jgi:hypothetical protein
MHLDFSSLAGNILSVALLAPIVVYLFGEYRKLIERVFAMYRENTEELQKIIAHNTAAYTAMSTIITKCHDTPKREK